MLGPVLGIWGRFILVLAGLDYPYTPALKPEELI